MHHSGLRRNSGFTLLEMMIVIVIISILMALLVVLIGGLEDGARNRKTLAMIQVLKAGVLRYHTETNYQGYPPDNEFGADPDDSSKCLHKYLGQKLRVPRAYHSGGTIEYMEIGPLIQFEGGYLEGGVLSEPNPAKRIVDLWNKPIRWDNLNSTAGEIKNGFTIQSGGKDGDFSTTEDNVTEKDRQ